MWGDVQQNVTSTKEEYFEYREKSTKTRTGITSESQSFRPKMFENRGTYFQIYENIFLNSLYINYILLSFKVIVDAQV